MRFDEVHDHVVVHFVIRFNDVPALERNERHVGPQLGLEGQGHAPSPTCNLSAAIVTISVAYAPAPRVTWSG